MPNYIADLNDEHDFPTWDHLPAEDVRNPQFHVATGTNRPGRGSGSSHHPYPPSWHWCLLGEIQSFETMSFMRYRTVVTDDNGE